MIWCSGVTDCETCEWMSCSDCQSDPALVRGGVPPPAKQTPPYSPSIPSGVRGEVEPLLRRYFTRSRIKCSPPSSSTQPVLAHKHTIVCGMIIVHRWRLRRASNMTWWRVLRTQCGGAPIRHREFTRRCFMELRASESVSIESSTGFSVTRERGWPASGYQGARSSCHAYQANAVVPRAVSASCPGVRRRRLRAPFLPGLHICVRHVRRAALPGALPSKGRTPSPRRIVSNRVRLCQS